MTTETLTWLIPFPPLLAFFLIVLFTNKNKSLSHWLAIGSALLSWLGGMIVFLKAISVHDLAKSPIASSINWIPTADTWLRIGVLIDPLSSVVLFFVAWTVLMIFIYSVGYHNFGQPEGDHDLPGLPPGGAQVSEHGTSHTVPSVEPMYSRFFAFISLFAFGMLVLVVSDNLLTLFVGWEIMGLCSYLLIGFWYAKEAARRAAVKAFMTTRIGDVFMLLGIAFLYSSTGSLTFSEIFKPQVLHTLAIVPTPILGLSAAGLIGLMLFIGTVGKSAQFPLHVWLPDAMEGPTPVSAMIHAATMVSAGVYLVIRMFPLLSLDPKTMTIVAFIGAFTALFAATIAVAQNDIKRVLAYSTISQLGYMIAALGTGAYVAAAFHLFTHAFFKALLFLGSGSVIHGIEHGILHTGDHAIDAQDMFNMGGLRKRMPITFWTFLIGGFALSGFPVLTAGFWSKDEIFSEAFGSGHLAVFITLALAAFLTAFYTMRQITLTFLGHPRTSAAEHAQENGWTMTVPLIVLSVFAVSAGWISIPEQFSLGGLIPNWFHDFVGSTYGLPPNSAPISFVPLLTSIIVAVGGLSIGWLVYRRVTSASQDILQIQVLKKKWYLDEIYAFIFIKPSVWFAQTVVYGLIDQGLIDGILHLFGTFTSGTGSTLRNSFDKPVINGLMSDGSSWFVRWIGWHLRPIQSGRIQQYLVISLIVILVLAGLLYYLRVII
jgi:NADH-quinone oxidoreductase subunit L